MYRKLLPFFVVLSSLLCACFRQKSDVQKEAGDTLCLKYAENISIVKYEAYTIVELKDPWHQDKVLNRYVLTHGMADSTLPKGTVVRVPLQRAVSFNTAHASLAGMLGATNQIKGVADLKFMLLPAIQQRVRDGRIIDCGDAMAPDIEKIIDLKADAVLLSPFENSGGYGRLENIGVPIIECADYMETSALGRAEWMKFYGLLFGKEHEADSLFTVVDSSYHALSALAHQQQIQSPNQRIPTIITEKLTGSTWYVPGGKSSVGQLIADANGSYAWKTDKHSGSLALPFETILDKAGNADLWLFNDYNEQPMTYDRLAAEYHGYTMMKAFKKKNVWYVNSLKVPYFEEVSFRPDQLLKDYIILLHPALLKEQPRYYRKLNE